MASQAEATAAGPGREAEAPLTFTSLLQLAGLSPSDVRLLRHQDTRYPGQPSPYVLWRDDRPRFEVYQSTQSFQNAARLRAPIWASFVGLPDNETLFAGLYAATHLGPLAENRVHPMDGGVETAGSCDLYRLDRHPALQGYIGKLIIQWGAGYRTWIQRADGAPKPIVELRRTFAEPPFPGFGALSLKLSEMETLPRGWATALAATRGVYLLACPRTREHYVGSASGADGFLGRWRDYAANLHGGNIAMKARDPSDYQVSILETVPDHAQRDDIIHLEERWKSRLMSKTIGLNL